MSKRFETKRVERVETHTIEHACDICKRTMNHPEWGEWDAGSSYDVNRVRISHEEGSAFPEGGIAETVSFDLCPTCFRDVLTPFLESKGAVPNKSKDY